MGPASTLPAEFDRGVVTTVHQGEFYVSGSADVTYSTVLGSCIAACVRDRVANVGGMNHFLLAQQSGAARDRYGASARYGAFAMEQLINAVIGKGTGKKSNLEIKIFGGGKINATLNDVGSENIAFIRRFLADEGYVASSEDVGGTFARRVLFKPHSGRAFVKRLDSEIGISVAQQEVAIANSRPILRDTSADIELF